MPIELEQLPGEAIIKATIGESLDPERDIAAMFAEFIQLRMAIRGPVVLILDFSHTANNPYGFSQMVMGMAQAAQGIKQSKATGVGSPPITIFVGSDSLTDLAAQAISQEQYGGVRAEVCATVDEALALARSKLPV